MRHVGPCGHVVSKGLFPPRMTMNQSVQEHPWTEWTNSQKHWLSIPSSDAAWTTTLLQHFVCLWSTCLTPAPFPTLLMLCGWRKYWAYQWRCKKLRMLGPSANDHCDFWRGIGGNKILQQIKYIMEWMAPKKKYWPGARLSPSHVHDIGPQH